MDRALSGRYLLVATAILAGTAAAGQWHHLAGGRLSGISSIGTHVWAVGQDGLFLQSYDSGTTWRTVPRFTARHVVDVEFRDLALGLCTAEGDVVFRTTDAGGTWESTQVDSIAGRIRFLEGSHAVVTGKKTTLWSTDNGLSWTGQAVPGPATWFSDTLNGWSGGDWWTDDVQRSSDGGRNWAVVGSIPDENCSSFNAFGFVDSSGVCNYYGDVAHPRIPSYHSWAVTHDGGQTWQLDARAYCATCGADAGGRVYGLELKGCRVFDFEGDSSFPALIEPRVRLHDIATSGSEKAWVSGTGGLIWSSSNRGASWGLAHQGVAGQVREVTFTDSVNGWATTENAVLRTTDAGRTWTADSTLRNRTTADRGFFGLSLLGSDTVFVSEDDIRMEWAMLPNWHGTVSIHRTIDGGASWDTVHHFSTWTGNPWGASRLHFACNSSGWQAGAIPGGSSVRTTDGGETWVPMDILPSEYYSPLPHGYSSLDSTTAWLVITRGSVWHTTDAGDTWEMIHDDTIPLTDIEMLDRGEGFLTSHAGLMHTTDGGLNWELAVEDCRLNALDFSDERHGIAVGDSGVILRTTDRGETWLSDTSGFTTDLLAVFMYDSTRAWAAGDEGLVLGFGDWAQGVVSNSSRSQLPFAPAHIRCTPNPCARKVTLGFPHGGVAELTISDVAGRVVRELRLPGHKREVMADLTSLPAGVYFVSAPRVSAVRPARLVKAE